MVQTSLVDVDGVAKADQNTRGATLGASAPASIVACNGAYGTCQAVCAALLLAPTF